MDKPKEKKHIHLNAEEKRHVAQLIANGATYNEVNSWHLMRFGKIMTMSKFYSHKKKHKKPWKIINTSKKESSGKTIFHFVG